MVTVANPIYDEVLSIFDQTNKDARNRQVLNIDETLYSNDEDMNRILNRLLSAASDAKVRQDMNVEEEYFSAIEHRDTAIMMRDKRIEEQDNQIAEQNNQIAEQNNQIAEQRKVIVSSVHALREAGLSIDKIAEMLQKPIDEINELLS